VDELESEVAAVVRGDSAAFRRIVEKTSHKLVRLGARILGSTEEAEDVVQEAYVRAYRSLTEGSFDQRASVKTWLYRIVVNAAIDARRRRVRRLSSATKDQVGAALGSWEPSIEARLALAELAGWLAVLPEEQRLAILLIAVEGLSTREAAEILGCSEGAVEQRLVRARVTLRQKREAP
jgi:RNA polymerase sigma-70 factor (ECF subfamily)